MADRIYSIDSMRIIAMAFVVTIHTDPFRGLNGYGNMVNFVTETAARFAVPFFFIASGYFFALKITRRDPTAYLVRRVATIASLYAVGLLLAFPVFLAGTAVRASAKNEDVASSVVSELAEFVSPAELLYYGNSISVILWFLPALAFSLVFVYLFVRVDGTEYLLPVSLGFHVVGLLGASYTMFVGVPFEVRDALFFGFFYTSLGYALCAADWRPRPERSTRYLAATLLFGAVHLGERYVLGYVIPGETFADGVYTASYTIATALFTLSLFLFLLSRPDLGKHTSLPSWGNYAVGIYVVHPAVLYVLEHAGKALDATGYAVTDTFLWHLVLTPATFFGSLAVYLAILELGLYEPGEIRLPRLRRLTGSK
ncbi:acyltransferase [Natronococcus wangiae]|uniref:acyltransferase n=1 Tax=Natronococcus wangiae TaxID=3068275 RepID=UPI00273ECFB3|nr:acyltransferase [Natronococcus sp. AD5]